MSNPTPVVVFDLGGVLVDLGGVENMASLFDLAPIELERNEVTHAELRARWSRSAAVYDHESGRIDADAFARRFVEEQVLDLAPEEFLQRFVAWPQGLHTGAQGLVAQVAQRHRVCALSNTSAIHWQRMAKEFDLHALFSERYLSFEMKAMKPDADIYERLVAALGVPAENIVFLDDSHNNVLAAREQGINGQLAQDTRHARRVLEELSLL